MDPVSNNKGSEPRSINLGQRPVAIKPLSGHKSGKKGSMMKAVMALVVIVVVAAGGFFIMNQSKSASVDNSSYQAVFLTNGQVYFGKLKTTSGDYIELTNIYYLQTPETVQPADSTKANDTAQTQLVKLGNELHGPQDSMQISSKQVLFWENLKTDGKVVQAIAKYKP